MSVTPAPPPHACRFVFNTHVPTVSIVLGYSGKIHELVNVEAAAADKVPLVRRYTGGGTVVVDRSTGPCQPVAVHEKLPPALFAHTVHGHRPPRQCSRRSS